MPREHPRFSREINKHLLGDILSAVPVSFHATRGGAINEIDVAPHHFGKSTLIAVVGKSGEKLGVGHSRFTP